MPRRIDLKSVLVIGSGPVVIGQAAEFDYAGTQACRVLRAEGLRVTVVNSNPATVMTDPEFADATYVEPVTAETVERVIAKERPDALLATFGGRTALDIAVALHESGVLARYRVELIGADIDAVRAGADRERFRRLVRRTGAEVARSALCRSPEECRAAVADLGYPVLVRPASTRGGTGSAVVARDEGELAAAAGVGPAAGPTHEVLLEESLLGWKEFELEVMRDRKDNVVVVCSIENLDPVGVHTGDSISVAPAMTLTDREYRRMRDTAGAVIRAAGVDGGGCGIRFAVEPGTGRMLVIGMNPRVSRSSALAAKATGLPIAEIAARLAVGHTLDEIRDDSTRQTLAGFEPGLDHVAVKVPRFAFEEFPGADATLGTRMKSVGEAMAIGRSFPAALNKALRSLEQEGSSFSWAEPVGDREVLVAAGAVPAEGRINSVHQAVRAGATVTELAAATGIDPWFLEQIERIEQVARAVAEQPGTIDPRTLLLAKQHGLSDAQIGQLRGRSEEMVRELRRSLGIRPGYRSVDNCWYSSYDEGSEVPEGTAPKVVILGSGPHRIGQGAEFDHACVQAGLALAAAGYETVVVNCNPATVSTDHGTGCRRYCEPLTFEDVLELVAAERAAGEVVGVLVQLGGRTPLGLAGRLAAAGVPIVGTSPAGLDLAEDRGAFGTLLDRVGLRAPKQGTAASSAEARQLAEGIGYPVLVRPGRLPDGRGTEVVHDERTLAACLERTATASPDQPLLVERFLDNAVGIDVDALYDGTELYLGGVMEHIEAVGIHSGDSARVLPPITLGAADNARIRESTRLLAAGIGVRGPINVQYALASGVLYVLAAGPWAGRTVPFVSKATGVPLAGAAARVLLGATIAELRAQGLLPATGDGGTLPPDAGFAVRAAVLPWNRFLTPAGAGVDPLLGPETRATGEALGLGAEFGAAYARAQAAANGRLPGKGRLLVSVADRDKRAVVLPARVLADTGFEILATEGTAEVLRYNGVSVTTVGRPGDAAGPEGGPTAVGRILAGEVDVVVSTSFGNTSFGNTSSGNTSSGASGRSGPAIRTAAASRGVPCITTVQGLAAAVQAVEAAGRGHAGVTSLQERASRPRPTVAEVVAGPHLAAQARRVLPRAVFDYYSAGSGDEISVAEAAAAWRSRRLLPRVLRDVSATSTVVTLLGTELTTPVLAAPSAFHCLADPEGEVATARGVAGAGSLLVLSSRSTRHPEQVAETAGPWWAQIYCLRDPELTKRQVERVVLAGAGALVLTADTPYVAAKPRVVDPLPFPDEALTVGIELSSRPSEWEQDPAITLDAITWLREMSGLPVLVKGLLRADDAVACADAGAAGIVVSNHGGRQLDRALPTAHALSAVADAVGHRVPVLVDGGISTGADVLTALALGADAVLVGRPVLWALAVAGAPGVTSLLDSYREQLATSMALAGVADLSGISRDLLAPGYLTCKETSRDQGSDRVIHL